ncbi:hypothetical protein BD560DRAFT_396672 [Blakeslea trispora]|nr:hypothetical protein BD560DRAFT_396672 [Blakeslea trispora]
MDKTPLFELANSIENLIVQAQTDVDNHIETTEVEVLNFTEECKKKAIQLKEQKSRLISEIESVNDRKLELEKKLNEIHSRTLSSQEAYEKRQTLESVEQHNQLLRSERDQLESILQKKRKEQQAKKTLDDKLVKETMTQLQASINLMQLELINAKDNGNLIKVVMKHVNPHNPEQAFTLVHDLDEEERYRLVQSDPVLPQAYMSPILNELNNTRDYYAFLKKVRKIYQSL